MKKSIFAFIAFIFFAGFASGQTYFSTLREATGNNVQGGQESRQVLDCPPNSFYSQVVNYVNGFTSWTGAQFIVYDEILSTLPGPVGEITFFGVFFGEPGRNFQISFYHDNAGLPGPLITTYSTFIAGTNTGITMLGSYQIYSYNYILPSSVNLVAGDWVSIVADGSDYWYWCTASGGNGCLYQLYGYPPYNCDYGDAAFCLGGGPPLVPVTNWALYIGIGLILVFTLVRFRKMV